VTTAVVVEVVVAVNVAAASVVVAEPLVERCGPWVVIGDAQPDLVVAAVRGRKLRRRR
jgi:hypothetical protein